MKRERMLVMNNITFEKLNPTTEADVRVYEDAFSFVFSNKDIKNIAISGAYGAGKSSVLESYKERCKESLLNRVINFSKGVFEKIKRKEFNIKLTSKEKKTKNKFKNRKYVHISLAHFEDVKTNGCDKESQEPPTASKSSESSMYQGAMLEGKILNQLIHQIPIRKIPKTHFRVKKTTSWLLIFFYSLISFTLLVSLSHVIFFDFWKNYIQSLPSIHKFLEETISPYSRLISGAIFGIATFSFIYTIIRAQTNKNIIKKLNVNGTEIEIFENSNESYFDKYLNEVLYLFKQIDADVIVFEDIDRYDDVQIFERLREVNTLVNLQPNRKGKEPLRFFYMLRDDIFQSKDRTKFFDFIIPIVPVIDGSNSFNQFKDHLMKNNIYEEFDPNFLQSVARYVDEMRLLKNISNEFLIYFNRMAEKVNLNRNKMFAMILYKNLFPGDFCELQLGRGFVGELFNNKSKFIEDEIISNQNRIEKILTTEESHLNEIAKSQAELDIIFKEKIPSSYQRGRSDWATFLPSPYDAEYEERSTLLRERKENQKLKLHKERVDLEERIHRLNTSKLSEIISRENAKRIFAFTPQDELGEEINCDEIKTNPYFSLLKYLIRNGYIDESYSDYMTYFYANTLSNVDKNFLISVTDKEAKEYTYELRAPQLVFESLRIIDFEEEETLNFSLFGFLIAEKKDSEHLRRFVSQLREKKKYEFVYQYYALNVNTKELVVILNSLWPTLFTEMLTSTTFTPDVVKSFAINSLENCTEEELRGVNGESKFLTEYISNNKSFLNIDNPNAKKIISELISLGVKFRELDYEVSDKDLFEAVYNGNLYELNYDNIVLMLRTMCGCTNDYELQSQNYTLVSRDKSASLCVYVNNNFPQYIDLILANCGGEISDAENVACDILNDTRLTQDQKIKYIDFLSTSVSDLTLINEKTYWPYLAKASNVEPSWKNILLYYSHVKEIGEELIKLINECNDEFSNEFLIEENSDVLENFMSDVVVCDDIDNSQYASILDGFTCTYEKFEVEGISKDKMELLISKRIIELTPKTLTSLRQNYPSLILNFIKANIREYLSVINAKLFVYDEMLSILKWDIDDQEKIDLIALTDDSISIANKNYSDLVATYILEHNLDINDIEILLATYDGRQSSVNNWIYKYVKLHIDEIMESQMKINSKLRNDLLVDENITLIDKVSVLGHTISEYTKSEMIDVLMKLGMSKVAEVLVDNKYPHIPINAENKLLLEAFKENGWIAEYEENPNKLDFYRIKRGRNLMRA